MDNQFYSFTFLRGLTSGVDVKNKIEEFFNETDSKGSTVYDYNAKDDTIYIKAYGPIGDFGPFGLDDPSQSFTAKGLSNSLEAHPNSKVVTFINSVGGSVNEAKAMLSIYDRHNGAKEFYNDGLAASAATLFPQVGDFYASNDMSSFLFHKVWGLVIGNSSSLRKVIGLMDREDSQIAELYSRKASISKDEILNLMDKDQQISAKEAENYGFIQGIRKLEYEREEETEDFANLLTNLEILTKPLTPTT